MGITREAREFLLANMREAKIDLADCKMLEFGNQILRSHDPSYPRSAKTYFSSLNVWHTSVDINGKDGALCIDLQNSLSLGEFDVVTNFGTSEHILKQFPVFQNMHESCRVGGLITHVVPSVANPKVRKPHGLWLYGLEFFLGLAEMCKYKVLTQEIRLRGKSKPILAQVFAAFVKSNHSFPERAQFLEIAGRTQDVRIST